MLHATAILAEREKATTAGWLVMGSIDRKPGIMTIQESPNAAVANKEHVARSFSRQDVFDLANNARLGIDRPLPAPNADVGLREELIGDGLELVRHQETCRRSIVFMHRLANLDVDVQLRGNNLGCLDRLPLSAGDDLRRP